MALLARQLADRLGEDPYADMELPGGEGFAGFEPDPEAPVNLLGEGDVARIAAGCSADPHVQAAIDETVRPVLTPQQLLADLFASRGERLGRGGGDVECSPAQGLLRRGTGWWLEAWLTCRCWTKRRSCWGSDVIRTRGSRMSRRNESRLEYALGVLEIAYGSRSIDVEDEARAGTS